MSDLKIVSVDMFWTLADVDTRKYEVWREFLGEDFTEELADNYWKAAGKCILRKMGKLVADNNAYFSVRSMFTSAYKELFSQIGLDYDPEKAAGILAYQHSLSSLYSDVLPFLTEVGNYYPICLASDTDSDMLGSLTRIFPFDYVFTSEKVKAYKNDPEGRFFKHMLNHYDMKADQILHIGDSSADVLGSKKSGLRSCWLNRSGRKWNHDVTPEYEVKSLLELLPILGLKGDPDISDNPKIY